jgi:hypothetical protein
MPETMSPGATPPLPTVSSPSTPVSPPSNTEPSRAPIQGQPAQPAPTLAAPSRP